MDVNEEFDARFEQEVEADDEKHDGGPHVLLSEEKADHVQHVQREGNLRRQLLPNRYQPTVLSASYLL